MGPNKLSQPTNIDTTKTTKHFSTWFCHNKRFIDNNRHYDQSLCCRRTEEKRRMEKCSQCLIGKKKNRNNFEGDSLFPSLGQPFLSLFPHNSFQHIFNCQMPSISVRACFINDKWKNIMENWRVIFFLLFFNTFQLF